MNEKDNELDIILNHYSNKNSGNNGDNDKNEKEKMTSIDELDALLGDVSGLNSVKSEISDNDEISEEKAEENSENNENKAEAEDIKAENYNADEPVKDSDDVSEPEENEDLTALKISDNSSKSNKKIDKPKKKKVKRKKTKVNSSIFVAFIVVCVVLTVSFAVAFCGINMGMEYLGVGKKDVSITLNIPKGSGSAEITELLYDNGLIDNKTLFKLSIKIKKAGGNLKPGDITLSPSMGYDAIIEELCETRQSYEQVTITFKEGISLYDAANLLEENGVCSADEFLYQFNSENFGYDYESEVVTSAEKFYKFEGFFFPDTYSFYVDDSAYNVTKNMRAQFEKVMNDNNLYEKIEKSDFTIEEVIILASIVQAEAATEEDMQNVASVFINRLNNSSEFPKLQSDATDNYYNNVIVPQSGDSISLAMFQDAYDTYVKDGLPSGAVGNPGLDAILAVVDAPETDYLYFCSNLETKECFFAETLSEHEENLKKAGLVNE